MKTLALWTIKGGVGKTTGAVNLAHAASLCGLRVLLWDLDPQGSASFFLRITARLPGGASMLARKSASLRPLVASTDFSNLHIVPADFSHRFLDRALDAAKKPHKRLQRKLQELQGEFDLVLLDCAPSVSTVSEAVLASADAVAVPVIPSVLSLRSLEQVRRVIAELGPASPQLLPYLSMLDRRRRLHLEVAAECLGDPAFLPTAIPYASAVEKMGIRREPLTASHPGDPAAAAFRSLWGEMSSRLYCTPAG